MPDVPLPELNNLIPMVSNGGFYRATVTDVRTTVLEFSCLAGDDPESEARTAARLAFDDPDAVAAMTRSTHVVLLEPTLPEL